MDEINRRRFITATTLASIALFLPGPAWAGMSPVMTVRLRVVHARLSELKIADTYHGVFRQRCEDAGWMEQDKFWDWYQTQPVRVAYCDALEDARSAVEAAFMTGPQTQADEDAVMKALDAYQPIAPSGFAMQTARDLFTPARFQAYPHDRDRDWLLNEPDEAFEKSPVPDFLWRVRETHRQNLI